MKIRNPRLLRAASSVAAAAMTALVRTLRFELRCVGPVAAPIGDIPPGPRYAYAIWHENLLLPTVRLGHPDLAVLISKHADGQLLAGLIRAMGMGMIAGSTNRGGVEAVRQIVNGTAGRRHLVVTPDGPRGPRRVVQPGVVYAASRAGMQVVPVGVGYAKAFRLKSWDRFAVPRPGSRAVLITGDPIAVPADAKSAELEVYRGRVQAEMERVNAAAERWALTGRLDAGLLSGGAQ